MDLLHNVYAWWGKKIANVVQINETNFRIEMPRRKNRKSDMLIIMSFHHPVNARISYQDKFIDDYGDKIQFRGFIGDNGEIKPYNLLDKDLPHQYLKMEIKDAEFDCDSTTLFFTFHVK